VSFDLREADRSSEADRRNPVAFFLLVPMVSRESNGGRIADPHGVCDVKDRLSDPLGLQAVIGIEIRSGIPFRVLSDALDTGADLAVAAAASLELTGSSGSLTSSPLPQCGSTVSPSADRLRVVGLSRAPSMILMCDHRTFEGHPGARMPLACGPPDLRLSFRDAEFPLSFARCSPLIRAG
jgi:hypothetical protein